MTAEPTDGDEARAARERAERKLEATQRRDRAIDRITDRLDALREENNFVFRLTELFRSV